MLKIKRILQKIFEKIIHYLLNFLPDDRILSLFINQLSKTSSKDQTSIIDSTIEYIKEDHLFDIKMNYTDRESKATYVFEKYKPILENAKILDIGADECHLREYLPDPQNYFGIGLGGHPDLVLNLENEKIPFGDKSYDCTICLDVLEHVDNIHEIFDECCRMSNQWVIISLPNPFKMLIQRLITGNYKENQLTKFYGLPLEKPADRHKWFFTFDEANQFIAHRAKINGFSIVQIDTPISKLPQERKVLYHYLFPNKEFDFANFQTNTIWYVLKRNTDE
jgi:hypothetical protein